jgi:predicted O-methyltransferase YrrM
MPTDQAATVLAPKWLNYLRRLGQPVYWPQLARMALRGRRAAGAAFVGAEQAAAACATRATPLSDAFAAIGLEAPQSGRFAVRHEAEIAAARARVAAFGGHFGGGADIDVLYEVAVQLRAKRILETGVALGWSSFALLSAVSDASGEGGLWSIDLPYLGKWEDERVGAAIPDPLRRFWTLTRGADRDVLEKVLAKAAPLDLVHYDSDKSPNGRAWAYPRLWAALAPGGVLISDDIADNMAFLDFCDEIGFKPAIVRAADQKKFVGLLRKPR